MCVQDEKDLICFVDFFSKKTIRLAVEFSKIAALKNEVSH